MKTKEIYNLYIQSYHVSTDSRKITPKCLYFAFKGEHFNGNEKAEEAKINGAIAAFVDEKEFANPSQNIFYVKSTLRSLQKLAKYHRKQLNIPLIGLTGSNGKTTTKELMAAVLNQKFKTLYTYGNLNNHLGVPLTLLRISPDYEMAIIEMGANHKKEIKQLSKIARPDIGYITNFGKAHLEGFGGINGVIKGKSELYDYLRKKDKTALVNEADSIQLEKSKSINSKITFGLSTSDYYFNLLESSDKRLKFQVEDQEIQTQLTGDYNFPNASAAASLGLYFGINADQIKKALENYTPENQRSQLVKHNTKTIVLDAYNANPSSMKAAIENFLKFEGSKAVILGDMFELGDYSNQEHQIIVNLVQSAPIDESYFIGEHFYTCKNKKSKFFQKKSDFEDYLKSNTINSENILIKASRGIALETILDII